MRYELFEVIKCRNERYSKKSDMRLSQLSVCFIHDITQLIEGYEERTEEVKEMHKRIESLLITQKMLRQTNSNLEYLYDKERGVL